MELDLRKAMENLKNITCELIDKLKQDDYNVLENLMNKRQELLNNLEKMDYTKDEYCEVVDEFQIIHFQQELSKIMIEKRHKLKNEIDNISKKRVVTKGYSKHLGGNIFSKKI